MMSMLSLIPKDINISIETCTGKKLQYSLKNDCVLGYLTSLIADEIGIPSKHQRLVYRSETLKGEARTMSELGIGNESEIALLHPVRDAAGPLAIVLWEKKKPQTRHLIEGEWDISWSTDRLREEALKLHNVSKIKSNTYRMVHNAITMPNDYAIIEFDVSADSTVFILPKKE